MPRFYSDTGKTRLKDATGLVTLGANTTNQIHRIRDTSRVSEQVKSHDPSSQRVWQLSKQSRWGCQVKRDRYERGLHAAG
jgi:hypothetical protein